MIERIIFKLKFRIEGRNDLFPFEFVLFLLVSQGKIAAESLRHSDSVLKKMSA